MLKSLRYKVAVRLFKKAVKLMESGNLKDYKKGLKYCGMSLLIVSPSDDNLSELLELTGQFTEQYQIELES